MGKLKFFIFFRSYGTFDLSLLDLTILEGSIFQPKNIWQYLGFIFDRKLTFQQHADFYTNKLILTIKCMKMLVNSSRDLIPTQKKL